MQVCLQVKTVLIVLGFCLFWGKMCGAETSVESHAVEEPAREAAKADTHPAVSQESRAASSLLLRNWFIPEGRNAQSSVYIPLDSWIYPAATRLYSMGYISSAYLGMRPWTRRSLLNAIECSQERILSDRNEDAIEILAQLLTELGPEAFSQDQPRGAVYGVQSAYTRLHGITGTSLRDSFHLGQTLVNDYGRPYQPGFNGYSGMSFAVERGRFSLYVRGEYQHAPRAVGYSAPLVDQLTALDETFSYSAPRAPVATIPSGPVSAQNPLRLIEASLSYHLARHEISIGKTDAWLGPGRGGAMAWSNNAEDIYSLRVNRVEPLNIPLLSRALGPLRYDFIYGSLKGHINPNDPWVHSEMFSFKPTENFEFGFQRSVIFGGKGHEPVTLHTFVRSFFSLANTSAAVKNSRFDPGARYSDFNFSWRLPFVRKYLTLYLDSIVHDDVSPISAPRRAAYRTGIYLSQIPGLKKVDFRVEAVTSDPPVSRSMLGQFNYWEQVQVEGLTNKGQIIGDWVGREAKGGQAWLTYHRSGNEWVEVEYLDKKTPKDFIVGGTTQNAFTARLVKRFNHDYELNACLQVERWKAPIYLPGAHNDTTIAVQFSYFPKLRSVRSGH